MGLQLERAGNEDGIEDGQQWEAAWEERRQAQF